MRPPWRPGAVKLIPQRPARIVPSAEPNPNDPALTDADRVKVWRRIAEMRLARMLDLEATVDRLRADLDLARNLAVGPVDCGHGAALRRYDHDRRVCQREHVDEIERLNAQVVRLGWAAGHGEGMPF